MAGNLRELGSLLSGAEPERRQTEAQTRPVEAPRSRKLDRAAKKELRKQRKQQKTQSPLSHTPVQPQSIGDELFKLTTPSAPNAPKPVSQIRAQQHQAAHTQLGSSLATMFGTPQPQAAVQKKRKRKKRTPNAAVQRTLVIATIIMAVLGGIGVSGYLFRDQAKAIVQNVFPPAGPFSRDIRQKYDFPLLYPTRLPAGYLIDKSTLQEAKNFVFYKATDDKDHAINITLQKAIKDKNPVNRLAIGGSPRTFDVPGGTASVYTTSDGLTAAFVLVDKTWVFINMERDLIKNGDLDAMLKSFK
jgi:hypothetical protein